MKVRLAVALCVLFVLPSAAFSATGAPWADAKDIQAAEPGMLAKDAACVAHFYRGRLSREAWLTPYYKLTRAQMLVTDAGYAKCMTPAERAATLDRTIASVVGEHPELTCAARALSSMSEATRLTFTTLAKQNQAYDRAFRACRLTGVLYARTASETHLVLTVAEQACTNRIGTADPVVHRKGAVVSKAFLRTIGTVFDKCVGAKSEEAMYRWVFRQFPLAKQIPCIAHGSAAKITFADLLSGAPSAKATALSVTKACMAGKAK